MRVARAHFPYVSTNSRMESRIKEPTGNAFLKQA
jgi:hypothetical protein